jgi:hypothetical protein
MMPTINPATAMAMIMADMRQSVRSPDAPAYCGFGK